MLYQLSYSRTRNDYNTLKNDNQLCYPSGVRHLQCSLLIIFLLVALMTAANAAAKVYLVKTADRTAGIEQLLQASPLPDLTGKKVVIKANFNSDDPFPATTNIETLKTVIDALKEKNPASITIIERSGMGNTQTILDDRGVTALAEQENVALVNLDKLPKSDWIRKGAKGTHWRKGYLVPRVLLEADYVVNLPCLKTHRFGGDFTMSLKNNVGAVAKYEGIYNYMWELHLSPSQRLMIAEINKEIPCDLVIMDGTKAFSIEGPDRGKLIEPGLIILAHDRVANDAVGVAVLRTFGTTKKVMAGKIFDQQQLKRAAELGIGVKSAAEIELVPVNEAAKADAERIAQLLTADKP